MPDYYWTGFTTHGQQLADETAAAGMREPVRCAHCYRIYDLSSVHVTARYTDCSMWAAPCCGRQVDDRGEGWGGRPDYTPIPNTTTRNAAGRWDTP